MKIFAEPDYLFSFPWSMSAYQALFINNMFIGIWKNVQDRPDCEKIIFPDNGVRPYRGKISILEIAAIMDVA